MAPRKPTNSVASGSNTKKDTSSASKNVKQPKEKTSAPGPTRKGKSKADTDIEDEEDEEEEKAKETDLEHESDRASPADAPASKKKSPKKKRKTKSKNPTEDPLDSDKETGNPAQDTAGKTPPNSVNKPDTDASDGDGADDAAVAAKADKAKERAKAKAAKAKAAKAAAKAKKKADDADTGGKRKGAESGEDDDEEVEGQDEEEKMKKWEGSVYGLRRRRIGVTQNAEVLAEVEAARIGSACITAAPINNVQGVVELGFNPNRRANPRGITDTHVKALYDIIKRPGGKRDSESPVCIAVPLGLIRRQCLEEMKNVDARNPAHTMPMLELVRAEWARENDLEDKIWLRRQGNKWLSVDDIAEDVGTLAELRDARIKALLLNGNHRLRALLMLAGDINRERDRVVEAARAGSLTTGEAADQLAAIAEKAQDLTWRVMVYDADKLSPAAKNYLVQNEHELPALGTGAGEKGWWLAQHFTNMETEALQSGAAKTREQALNLAQAKWRTECGKGMVVAEEDEEETKGRSHAKGSMVGEDGVSRLFTEATSMEMVLDCRAALWAFGNTLTKTNASNMLKHSGAPLVAHFWLALRTLIKICNVAGGDDLSGAEDYIAGAPKLTAEGDQAAVAPWTALHVLLETTPQLLSVYDKKVCAKFDKLYEEVCAKFQDATRNLRYDDPATIVALRGVFEELADFIEDPNDENLRRVAASLRLYARLPLGVLGSDDRCFYPAAALPSPKWMSVKSGLWSLQWKLTREAVAVVEVLLQRYQLVWTMGAQGTNQSCNWNNWYRRSPGLHQILLGCFEAKEAGCIEARLSEAIDIFDDVRLPLALHHAKRIQESMLYTLVSKCCARKSGMFDYPAITPDLIESFGRKLGSTKDVKKSMGKARSQLKLFAFSSDHKLTLEKIRRDHPILNIIDDGFWSEIDVVQWLEGWRDAPPKQINSVGALVGWGVLTYAYVGDILKPVMRNSDARWLLAIVDRVCRLRGEDAWWQDMFELEALPDRPTIMPPELEPTKAKKEAKDVKDDKVVEPPKSENQRQTRSQGTKDVAGKKAGGNGDDSSKSAASKDKRASKSGKSKPAKSASRVSDSADEAEKLLDDVEKATQDENPDKDQTSDGHEKTDTEMEDLGKGDETAKDAPVDEESSGDGESDAEDEQVRTQIPTDHHLVHDLVESSKPNYLCTTNRLSTSTLQGYYGIDVSMRKTRPFDQRADKDTLRIIGNVLSNHRSLNIMIANERQYFRESLSKLARLTLEMPYGSDFAVTWLAPSIEHLKDLYIIRLAKSFKSLLRMQDPEALNEASLIASTDGLTTDDIFTFDDKSGELLLDFKTSFAAANQHSVANESIQSLGFLKDNEKVRRDTTRLMQYFKPSRGPGRTIQESVENGVDAVAHAAHYVDLSHQLPGFDIHLEPNAKEYEAAMARENIRSDHTGRSSDVVKKGPSAGIQSQWSFVPAMQTSASPQSSGYSTGQFLPDDWSVPRVSADDTSYMSIRDKLQLASGAIREDWRYANNSDLQNYKQWTKTISGAVLGSRSNLGFTKSFDHSADFPTSAQPRRHSPSPPATQSVRPTQSNPASPSHALNMPGGQNSPDADQALGDSALERRATASPIPRPVATMKIPLKTFVLGTPSTVALGTPSPRPGAPSGPSGIPTSSPSLGGHSQPQLTSFESILATAWSTQQSMQREPSAPQSDAESDESVEKGLRPGTPTGYRESEDNAGKKRKASEVDDSGSAKRRAMDTRKAETTDAPDGQDKGKKPAALDKPKKTGRSV